MHLRRPAVVAVRGSLGGALLAAALASACSGSTDPGPASSGPVPKDRFASEAAAAICDNIGPCCSREGYAHDAAACRNQYAAFIAQVLLTGNVSYDAAAAGECLAVLRQVAQSCGEMPDDNACLRVVAGTLGPGEACTRSSECAAPEGGRASCRDDRCEVAVRAKLGEACSGTCAREGSGVSCSFSGPSAETSGTCYVDDGLYCAETSFKCERVARLNEPCDGWRGCEGGAWCNGGVCVAQSAAGGPCASSEDCQAGLDCDWERQQCAAPQPDGSACVDGSSCASERCKDGKCAPSGGEFADEEVCNGTGID